MKRQLVKWLLYISFALILYSLQTAFGDKLTVCRINLIPFLICTVAVFEDRKRSAWFGFFAGILSDAFHPMSTGFFPVVYFLSAYLVGTAVKSYLTESYLTATVLGTVVSFVSNVFEYIIFYMIFYSAPVSAMLYESALSVLYSLIFSIFVYFPVSLIRRVSGVIYG